MLTILVRARPVLDTPRANSPSTAEAGRSTHGIPVASPGGGPPPTKERTMAARSLTVVCAWCHRIVAVAPADDGVTHTICESCFDWTLTHPAAQVGVEAIEF